MDDVFWGGTQAFQEHVIRLYEEYFQNKQRKPTQFCVLGT